MRPIRTLFILAAAAVLAIAALVLVRARSTSPPAPASLRLAPDIEIVMYQGEAIVGGHTIALSSLWQRDKPVVLNFWAALCPPCRAEMPDFERLYRERSQDNFALIGVDIGPFMGLGSREEGRALLRELRVTFPAGTTLDARTPRNYQIVGMPTTVFITPQGRILRKYAGQLTFEQMQTFTDDLIRASAR